MPLRGEAFDVEMAKRLQKPERGSRVLAKEKARAEDTKAEDEAKKQAKLRDWYRCRWPEAHKCRGHLEGAHVRDKSTGGKASNVRQNILSICRWIHRSGPLTIHDGDYEIKPLTKFGTDGPVAIYRRIWLEGRRGESKLHLLGRERAIHQWEKV